MTYVAVMLLDARVVVLSLDGAIGRRARAETEAGRGRLKSVSEAPRRCVGVDLVGTWWAVG